MGKNVGLLFEDFYNENILEYFKSFTGAKRRFTETFAGNNVIIDDYAHHPNEVKSTINAISQKYPDKDIIGSVKIKDYDNCVSYLEAVIYHFDLSLTNKQYYYLLLQK